MLDRQAQLLVTQEPSPKALPLLEEARVHHDAARRANPKHPIYRQHLAHHWHVTSLAQYRQGQWRPAIDALEKKMQLDDGDACDCFLLAMACWQLGDQERARGWYDKAVTWLSQHRTEPGTDTNELRRLKGEASTLLGITDRQTPKGKRSRLDDK